MKRTEIKYASAENGEVEITGIKNAASGEEVEEEFGAEVRRLYFEEEPYYFRCGRVGGEERVRVNDGEYSLSYWPGLRLTKKGFGKLIKTMKAAGDRLQRIREEVAKRDEKTAFI